RRGIGDSVGAGVAAAAAAPAEHLLAGPDHGAEAVVHTQERRRRQLPPRVGGRVVRQVRALPPDEHLLAGPDGAQAHEAGRPRRRRKLAPGAGARVVGGRNIDRAGEPGRFYYQRDAHPTGVEAERELGRLDGGHALLFPSGAGATTAFALAFLSPGDTLALAEGAYFGTGNTFKEFEHWGLRVV